ncbi:MAG: rhodanese-like domain-containing protein [Actinobacteria bacterium]|nr:rhodanese-like domain-containing protein [Actinomycetota bacterium]
MLLQRFESEGLGQYSYLVGDRGEAVIIDPRLDGEEYERALAISGHDLKFVFETHRNEDYLTGSAELAERTGAQVWRADRHLDYKYGSVANDGQGWSVGGLSLKAIATPGHTRGHMSYLLQDPSEAPWMVFSGDALMAGSVGRTDLLGSDEAHDLARQLYESVFDRLLPLGDGVILCPAHGPGSACGGAPIADRPWTSIGFERSHNPLLSLDKETFVKEAARSLDFPPYFREMAWRNLLGPRRPNGLVLPAALPPEVFVEKCSRSLVLDVREPESFGGAHVPDSVNIYETGVSTFGGWFLPYDRPLLVVLPSEDPEPLVRTLLRVGHGQVEGYLAGGIHAWYSAGLPTSQIKCVMAEEVAAQLRVGPAENDWVLDVRSVEELESDGRIPGALNIPVRHLLGRLDEIPRDRMVTIVCGTGRRSMIAASLLRARGWERLSVVLGSISVLLRAVGAPPA